jgi:hypothetical protein
MHCLALDDTKVWWPIRIHFNISHGTVAAEMDDREDRIERGSPVSFQPSPEGLFARAKGTMPIRLRISRQDFLLLTEERPQGKFHYVCTPRKKREIWE